MLDSFKPLSPVTSLEYCLFSTMASLCLEAPALQIHLQHLHWCTLPVGRPALNYNLQEPSRKAQSNRNFLMSSMVTANPVPATPFQIVRIYSQLHPQPKALQPLLGPHLLSLPLVPEATVVVVKYIVQENTKPEEFEMNQKNVKSIMGPLKVLHLLKKASANPSQNVVPLNPNINHQPSKLCPRRF